MKRNETKLVKIGNITIGNSDEVIVQSMCDIKTSNTKEVINLINKCTELGAKIMRVSILDLDDIKSLKEIKKHIKIPLVADIHYDLNLAILAIENGADGIRVNPGNTSSDLLNKVIDCAKKHQTCIRIGVNKGAININNIQNIDQEAELIVDKTISWVKYFENQNFFNLVLSCKDSNPLVTLKAYRLLATKTNYPLHIGVTESGMDEIGIIRSVSILSPLLLEGIGSTIRISLTQNPEKEVKTCIRLLHDLGMYPNYPTIISCPTCGRTEVRDLNKLAHQVLLYLEEHHIYKKVAIMGCIVNGINEGKDADYGLAGGKDKFVLFKNGKQIKTIDSENAYNELISIISKDLVNN